MKLKYLLFIKNSYIYVLSLFLRITVSACYCASRKVEFKVRLKVEQILVMIVKFKNLEILQFFFL